MAEIQSNVEPNPEVIQELRVLADGGATVRELVTVVEKKLGLKEPAIIPVVWYCTNAVSLTRSELRPLVDWLGTGEWLEAGKDKEIDSIIMSAIEKAKGR